MHSHWRWPSARPSVSKQRLRLVSKPRPLRLPRLRRGPRRRKRPGRRRQGDKPSEPERADEVGAYPSQPAALGVAWLEERRRQQQRRHEGAAFVSLRHMLSLSLSSRIKTSTDFAILSSTLGSSGVWSYFNIHCTDKRRRHWYRSWPAFHNNDGYGHYTDQLIRHPDSHLIWPICQRAQLWLRPTLISLSLSLSLLSFSFARVTRPCTVPRVMYDATTYAYTVFQSGGD